MTENNTPHDKVILPYSCCCMKTIFSHCVHLKLGHQFHALLKVCSDSDDIVPFKTYRKCFVNCDFQRGIISNNYCTTNVTVISHMLSQPVTYTDSTESVHVVWEEYVDEESGIKSFNIRLLEAASCDQGNTNNPTPVANQEWLVLGPNISEFTFVDLSLEVSLFPAFISSCHCIYSSISNNPSAKS